MKLYGGGGRRVRNTGPVPGAGNAAAKRSAAPDELSFLDDDVLSLTIEDESAPAPFYQDATHSGDKSDDWQPIVTRPAGTRPIQDRPAQAPVSRPAQSSVTRPAQPMQTPASRPAQSSVMRPAQPAQSGLDDWQPIVTRPSAGPVRTIQASELTGGSRAVRPPAAGRTEAPVRTADVPFSSAGPQPAANVRDTGDDWDPILSAALQPTVQLDPSETAAGQPAVRPRRPVPQGTQTSQPSQGAHAAQGTRAVPRQPSAQTARSGYGASRAAQTASRTAQGTAYAVQSVRGYTVRNGVDSAGTAQGGAAAAGTAGTAGSLKSYRWVDDEDSVYASSHGTPASPSRRRTEKARGKHLRWPLRLGIAAVVLLGLYLFAIYTTNDFVARWRTAYIETAMSTKSHQWLATAFIQKSIIDEVVTARYILDEEQEDMVSDKSLIVPTSGATIGSLRGSTAVSPSVPAMATTSAASTAPTAGTTVPGQQGTTAQQPVQQPSDPAQTTEAATASLPAGVMSGTLAVPTTAPTEPPPPTYADADYWLYSIYPELDIESFAAYAAQHENTMYDDGYIMIDAADRDGSGTSIRTVHGDKVLALDTRNGILLVRITGSSYNGVLAIVRDPSQVGLVVSSKLGVVGQRIPELCKNNNAILGINASGFVDDEGKGNGGVPYGYVVSDGEVLGRSEGWKVIGFDYDNILYTGSYKALDRDLRDAAEFKPLLINNGEIVVSKNDGWGINPRTTMGQTRNGSVLMLVVNGRGTNSLGCRSIDCANTLYTYGAVQASALDGGSSAVMYYNGRVITFPSGTNKTDGRQIPDAFVVYRAKS